MKPEDTHKPATNPTPDNGRPAATPANSKPDGALPPGALLPPGFVFVRYVGAATPATIHPFGIVARDLAYATTVETAAQLVTAPVKEFEPFRDEDRKAIDAFIAKQPKTKTK